MHVMARGIRRQSIFRSGEDYTLFKKIIEETMTQKPFQLLSYCLMTNHFHLLLTTQDTEIWKIMNRIMSSYARTFNQKYGYTGHLFDSRYVSRIVEDNVYLLEASRYIHLNPVKAGMVRTPMDYEYSSYKAYLGLTSEKILYTDNISSLFKRDPCNQYRDFVEGAVSHNDMESRIQSDMKEDENWLPW